jgi:hypothetical protein
MLVADAAASFRYFKTSPEIIQLAVMMYVIRSLRKFASVHASEFYHFNKDRSQIDRTVLSD